MNIRYLTIFILALVPSSFALAQLANNDQEVFKVICSNKVDEREIRYVKDKSAWCDTTIDSYCGLNQQQAAKRICSLGYKKKFDLLSKNADSELEKQTQDESIKKQERIAALERERVQIEKERLQIEQRRLELRQKEFELMKNVREAGMSGEI